MPPKKLKTKKSSNTKVRALQRSAIISCKPPMEHWWKSKMPKSISKTISFTGECYCHSRWYGSGSSSKMTIVYFHSRSTDRKMKAQTNTNLVRVQAKRSTQMADGKKWSGIDTLKTTKRTTHDYSYFFRTFCIDFVKCLERYCNGMLIVCVFRIRLQ